MKHVPLEQSTLSAGAQKALGGPMKMMAAKGLAPIADPADFVTVLYQISTDADAALANSAVETAKGLPENIVLGALKQSLAPLVIDFVAGLRGNDAVILEQIVFHNETHGETLTEIAAKGDAKVIGLIATNEAKLLGYPDIIAAMYKNPKAPMAIVDRAVELAIRNDVEVAIEAWEEIKLALEGGSKGEIVEASEVTAQDKIIEQLADPEQRIKDEAPVMIRDMSISQKIRLASVGNAFARAELIRDSKKLVAMAVIKSPAVSDNEVLKYANDHSLMDDVVRYIANKREWTRNYNMKLALVKHPKTPLRQTMAFMNFLRPPDLRGIAKSKGIPAAVVNHAKQLLQKRR